MNRRLVLLAAGAVLIGGCATPSTPSGGSPSSADVPIVEESVGAGLVYQGDGFEITVPQGWVKAPDDLRHRADAALEVGPLFDGQEVLPPSVMVWVDRGDTRGTAGLQSLAQQASVKAQLPDAEIGDMQHATVSGAIDATVFRYTYEVEASTSPLGTPVAAGRYTAMDMVAQAESGKPMISVRYNSAVADFDQVTWDSIVASLVVKSDPA